MDWAHANLQQLEEFLWCEFENGVFAPQFPLDRPNTIWDTAHGTCAEIIRSKFDHLPICTWCSHTIWFVSGVSSENPISFKVVDLCKPTDLVGTPLSVKSRQTSVKSQQTSVKSPQLSVISQTTVSCLFAYMRILDVNTVHSMPSDHFGVDLECKSLFGCWPLRSWILTWLLALVAVLPRGRVARGMIHLVTATLRRHSENPS